METFQEKIHQEILQTLERRHEIDIAKIAFVTALMGFGAVNLSTVIPFYRLLYLAPLVAVLFDLLIMREWYAIHRMGKFLRQHSPDAQERDFEQFVRDHRNPFYPRALFGFTLVTWAAAAFLLGHVKPLLETYEYLWFALVLLGAIALHGKARKYINALDEAA